MAGDAHIRVIIDPAADFHLRVVPQPFGQQQNGLFILFTGKGGDQHLVFFRQAACDLANLVAAQRLTDIQDGPGLVQ